MYVFAHQDDEMDVAGKIVTDMRKGIDVYCVWVTDGSHGGPAEEREKESRAVMALLGVPENRVIFLGFEDQNTYKHLEAINSRLLEITREIKPAEIMSHAYEGGNVDHDAVSFVSTLAARDVNAIHYEFPDSNIYQGSIMIFQFLPNSETPTLYAPLDKELFNLKMKLFDMYPTQSTGLSFYLLGMDKKSMKKNGEPYRVAPDYDYTLPPAAELRYASTSKGAVTYEMWRDAVMYFYSNNMNQ